MNPTIKDFSAHIKIVFCSFCKLSSGVCDSICHHACPCNSVVIWQLLTDEEKGLCYGRAVLGRQATADGSWPAHQQMLAESSISSTHQCLSTSHCVGSCVSHRVGCCVSHRSDNWLCIGLAHWEPVLRGPW